MNPLKNFGTFLTTIFIQSYPFFYFLQNSQAIPNINSAHPIKNSHPVTGSNNTNNIPVPIPTRQSPIVFFKASTYFTSFSYNILLIILHKCEQ